MSYVIRSKFDQRSLLALPKQPGAAVRWIDPIEGVAPWTFATRAGAERARDMNAHEAEVVTMEDVTLSGERVLHTRNLKLWRRCPASIGSSGL